MARVEIRADRLVVESDDEPVLDLACLALMLHADLTRPDTPEPPPASGLGGGMGFTTEIAWQPADGRYPQ